MPATTLVCPHCEKTVEIQASTVTRSRPCPECGEIVMLQMAEKSTKTKRRALLMGQNEPPAPVTPPQTKAFDEPQPLPGDAFERMRMDPEIHQFRRRLVIGAVFVTVIVVGLLVMAILRSSDDQRLVKQPVEEEGTKPSATASMIQPEEIQPPVTSGNLVFRPPGSEQLKTAQATTNKVNTESLAKLAAAEAVLGKFLQAADWKQRALLARDKLRVAPLMSAYYAKNADGPIPFDSIVEAADVSAKLSEHVVVFQGGGRRLATVEHTAEGPRVDWESFVGAGEMAWSDFIDSKPATPSLFRVLVSPAGHYENQFGNPAELACYSLRNISEPGAKVVYGYVSKSSPMAREIDYWVQKSNDATVPMILRLKFPLDATADFQVWIHQFVQSGWVLK
ncbi:hypothetical protein [Prosthecobacter sp.]|jgi:hypothetical protein|uniref:hypothetical protein n=1 Tax=Prosthecobacter sp. TaxID=1965333 RepID=UPI0037851051